MPLFHWNSPRRNFTALLAATFLLVTSAPGEQTGTPETLSTTEKTEILNRLWPAAEAGDSGAQFSLGTAYDSGFGVEQAPEKAAFWYTKAAQQGHRDAQFNLATLYEEGLGVTRNRLSAIHWYRRAAAKGSIGAQSNLGRLLATDKPPDYQGALFWFKQAAGAGHMEAKHNLGLLYLNGLGTEASLEKAKALFEEIQADYPPAAQALTEIQ